MTELFADVKIGDAVYCRTSSIMSRTLLYKSKVVKVTRAKAVLENHTSISRRNGREIGGGGLLNHNWWPETQELIAEYQLQSRRLRAERICKIASDALRSATGDDAIRLAELLPPELKGDSQ